MTEREAFAKHLAEEIRRAERRERCVGFAMGMLFAFAVAGFIAATVVSKVSR